MNKELFYFRKSGLELTANRFMIALIIIMIGLSTAVTGQTTTYKTISAGSFIVNMGVTPQTIANGLKPYGLLYALLEANCPVYWVINPSKAKDGIDFSHAGVDYRGGPFIIESQYRTSAVNTIISNWVSLGVVGTTNTSPIANVPVYLTFNNVPSWTLNQQNGSLVIPYFTNAGIPAIAYGGTSSSSWPLPATLDCCDDIFVMPHADPVWSSHQRLVSWNLECKGAIWNACHSPSALENMVDNITPNRDAQANFLTIKDPAWKGTTGVWTQSNSLILWGSHSGGTPPYTFNNAFAADPVAQYMGTIDAATQNGSEQIYMPRQGTVSTNPSLYEPGAIARWRPETKILVYDETQTNVTNPNLTTLENVAAVMVYGRGFGESTRGNVMHQAGHSHAKATGPANVAAQRAFFNFSFMAAWEKAVLPIVGPIPGVVYSGEEYPLSYSRVANVPPEPVQTYDLLWSASCGGQFLHPVTRVPDNTHPNPIYIPPTAPTPITCNISLTITDGCGRTTFDSEAVVVECNLQISTSLTNPCYNTPSGGAVEMTISNGAGPYTYSWVRTEGGSGSGTSSTAPFLVSGLQAGTYSFTVTSDNGAGCPETFSVTLTQSPMIIINATGVDVSCNGGSNGAVNVSVTGGIPGYTYTWTGTGSFSANTPNISGLVAGTYNLTVTDSKGCIESTQVIITEPSAIAITPTVTDVTCFGFNNGIINLAVTGGTPVYTYQWSDGNPSQNRTGLAPGNYSVTVTDANNCTQVHTNIQVSQPGAALTLSETHVNVLCFGGATGSIDLTVAGGTAPYNYSWSGPGGYNFTSEDPAILSAGVYSVTVTDAKGCNTTMQVTISQPPALSLSTVKTDPTCPADATVVQYQDDGTINLTVTGGTPPYTYFWSDSNGGVVPVGQTGNQNLTGLVAGTYTVLVTDANSCTATTSVTLIEQTPNPQQPTGIQH